MNRFIKAELQKQLCWIGHYVDCYYSYNSYTYSVGNKYITTWGVDEKGKKHSYRRIEIDEKIARDVVSAVSEFKYTDARRCKAILKIVATYYEVLKLKRNKTLK